MFKYIIELTTEAGTGIYAYSNGNYVAFGVELNEEDLEELKRLIKLSNEAWEHVEMYIRLQATNVQLVVINQKGERIDYRGKFNAKIAKFLQKRICTKVQHCRRGNTEGRNEIVDAIISGKAKEHFYPFDGKIDRADDAIRDSDFNNKGD